MKKYFFLLPLSLLLSTITCETNKILNPERMWGNTSNGLRCSINIEKDTFSSSAKTPLFVSIVVENVSTNKIELKAIPAFTLNDKEYWCPVDILNKRHLPANSPSMISLNIGASINSTIKISDLGWDLCLSSMWPQKNFYALIEPGKYKLRLDVEILEGSDPGRIFSNGVEFTITK